MTTYAEFAIKFRETIREVDAAAAEASRLDREAAYLAAFDGLGRLDPNPRRFRGCRIDGRLCLTFDEAVRVLGAIETRRAGFTQ